VVITSFVTAKKLVETARLIDRQFTEFAAGEDVTADIIARHQRKALLRHLDRSESECHVKPRQPTDP
jgi:hypothetical protein